MRKKIAPLLPLPPPLPLLLLLPRPATSRYAVLPPLLPLNPIVDTCFFCVFLLNFCYTWHKIPVHLSFPPDSGWIPSDFRQINLALEDLILTCVPRNLTESVKSSGFRKMRPVRNGKKSGMHNIAPRCFSLIE